MNECCKEWVLHTQPVTGQATTLHDIEEEQTCPTCQQPYLICFTCLGTPNTDHFQKVALTFQPIFKKRKGRLGFYGTEH